MFQLLQDSQNILSGHFVDTLSDYISTQTRSERKRKSKNKRNQEVLKSILAMGDSHRDYHTRNWG